VHTFRSVLLQKIPSQETLPLVILWEKYVQQSRQDGVALLCVYVQEEAASPRLPIAAQATDTNNSLYMNPNPPRNLQQNHKQMCRV
jgi:hypothetical protein